VSALAPAGFSLAPDQRAPVFSNRGKCL
jgi:hypothetical protein